MMENEMVSGRMDDSIMNGRVNKAGVRPGLMNDAVIHWVHSGFIVQNVSISCGCL